MKQFFPPADRNRHDILNALRPLLTHPGIVLEIASGSGQHAIHFARNLPHLEWQPNDPAPDAIESIAMWRDEARLPNLRPPVRLDAREWPWPIQAADHIVCINMIHISPWESTLGLMAGAGRTLPVGGQLILYGAYFFDDRPTAPSNLEFDASLRARDPRWGVRNLRDVTAAADPHALALSQVIDMPGNNYVVVFEKAAWPRLTPGTPGGRIKAQ